MNAKLNVISKNNRKGLVDVQYLFFLNVNICWALVSIHNSPNISVDVPYSLTLVSAACF